MLHESTPSSDVCLITHNYDVIMHMCIIANELVPLSTCMSYDLEVKVHFNSTTASELSPPLYMYIPTHVCGYVSEVFPQTVSITDITSLQGLGACRYSQVL